MFPWKGLGNRGSPRITWSHRTTSSPSNSWSWLHGRLLLPSLVKWRAWLEVLQGPLKEPEHDVSQSPLPLISLKLIYSLMANYPQAHSLISPHRASFSPSFPDSWGELDLTQRPSQALQNIPRSSLFGAPSRVPTPTPTSLKALAGGSLRVALSGSVHLAATEGRDSAQSDRRQWLQQEWRTSSEAPGGRRLHCLKQLRMAMNHWPATLPCSQPKPEWLLALSDGRKQLERSKHNAKTNTTWKVWTLFQTESPQMSLASPPNPTPKEFTQEKREGT